MIDFNILNFAFYNGLGVSAFIVLVIYAIFIWGKLKNRDFDWSVEFAVGIMIATFSTVIERIYYGTLRAFDLMQKGKTEELISPHWIISVIAIVGMIGLLKHIHTMTRYRFEHTVYRGALWIIFGTVCASAFWAYLL